MAKQQPGVMVYFDIRPMLAHLALEQQGLLLQAILTYAEDGRMPDFSDDSHLSMAWAIMQPRIDRDREAYQEKCEKARHAASCRKTATGDVPKGRRAEDYT